MKTIPQIINSTRQGETPSDRCNRLLTALQTQYHQAQAAGPESFAQWEQTFIGSFGELTTAVMGTPATQGAGAQSGG